MRTGGAIPLFFMEETLISLPVSFVIWLIICAISCIIMLIVQTGFVLHDISKEKKEKKKNE